MKEILFIPFNSCKYVYIVKHSKLKFGFCQMMPKQHAKKTSGSTTFSKIADHGYDHFEKWIAKPNRLLFNGFNQNKIKFVEVLIY